MATSVGRNDPCPCGSGLKYKQCCEGKVTWRENPVVLGAGVLLLLLIGIIMASMVFTDLGGGSTPDCPAGQVWSEAHGHCH